MSQAFPVSKRGFLDSFDDWHLNFGTADETLTPPQLFYFQPQEIEMPENTHVMDAANWLANRTTLFDSSGIREVFDLAKQLEDPVNLAIGQVDYPVPQPVKQALIESIEQGQTDYALTQGIAPLRNKLQQRIKQQYNHEDRSVFVCSGTSGGLVLSLMTLLNPGDEVIIFDPYFVMYPALPQLMGGVPVPIDLYPDFRLDIGRVADAITPNTKMIIANNPSNPTGICFTREETKQLAELASEAGVCLVSDEIYSQFVYDSPHVSPAEFNPQSVVVDGFSKSHAMTGLRLGYVHGPEPLINEMIKLQQFTFVCAPHPVQWAGITAMDTPIDQYVDSYRKKRDFLYDELSSHYDIVKPTGSFYFFPKLPSATTGRQFMQKAISENLLLIPGSVFSGRDTHFRIAFAVSDEKLQRGAEILKKLAS